MKFSGIVQLSCLILQSVLSLEMQLFENFFWFLFDWFKSQIKRPYLELDSIFLRHENLINQQKTERWKKKYKKRKILWFCSVLLNESYVKTQTTLNGKLASLKKIKLQNWLELLLEWLFLQIKAAQLKTAEKSFLIDRSVVVENAAKLFLEQVDVAVASNHERTFLDICCDFIHDFNGLHRFLLCRKIERKVSAKFF